MENMHPQEVKVVLTLGIDMELSQTEIIVMLNNLLNSSQSYLIRVENIIEEAQIYKL